MGVMTVGLVLISLPVVTYTFKAFVALSAPPPPMSPLASNEPPAGPRLQANEQLDYRILLADQQSKLDEYRWVNKQSGVVRIPIGEAIKTLARDGLPKPKQPESKDGASPSSEGAPAPVSDKTPS
jgi:hypothetical protein